MNSIKPILLLLIATVVFTFVSCDNEPLTGDFIDESGIPTDSNENTDDNNDGNSNIEVAPFYANVDGVEFTETSLQSYLLNEKLWVRGTDAELNKITLGFPTEIAVGTFEIVPDADTYEGIFSDNANNVLARADTGSITIITHDTTAKTISGTFNFTATPSSSTTPKYEVTEGEFNVSYQ
jgi:hypothetical protein